MKHDTKVITLAMIGNILEYYDFTLFIFLTPVLSPLFFPADNPVISMMAGLATYTVGYVMRPFGSLVFGSIGDRDSRRRALMLSIFMMSIPTGVIGLLPTYDQIGILAPVLLILCRLCQGLCTGGEYNGASLWTVENARSTGAGTAGAWVGASSAIGSLLGSGMTLLVTLPMMPHGAWRIAFLIGVLVAIVGFYLRRQGIEETQDMSPDIKVFVPLRTVLRDHYQAILCVFGMATFCSMMYTLTLRYTTIFLTTFLKWPMSQALSVAMAGTVLYIALMPLGGRIADRWGHQKMMIVGAMATLLGIYPILWLMSHATNWPLALAAEALLVILAVCFQSPMNAVMAHLFPATSRYRGVALGYTLGIALFGGTTTLVSTALTHYFNNPLMPCFYIMLGAVIGLIAVTRAKPKFKL